jgi:hypothetical protein
MVTRYTVDLVDGGELQLIRQNTEGTSETSTEQGREVVVGWRPQHTVAVRDGSTKQEVTTP